MDEQFRTDAGECPIDGIDIQGPDVDPGIRSNVGKLWTGARWLTVAQARELRDWLNEIIP